MKMKIGSVLSILTLLLVAGVGPLDSLRAQPTSADASGPIMLSEPDLEQLVAPIALYPDPLIALILPASTVPTDIVLANRFLNNGGDPDNIDAQPWDNSVKGLARYPDVIQMMDDNLDWTNQLGAAVLAQQADVMAAIQSQRAKAQALGNLQSTPQQQVVADSGVIQIVPADPQVIYVPYYDPAVVYVQAPPPAAPFITFSIGFAVGAWLAGDCDWRHHGIYYGGYYRPGYGWGYQNVTINNNYYWKPNPHRPPPRPPYRPNPGRPGGSLPGWRPPPNWGKPGKPGNPGGPNRPGGPGNRPPGKPNDRPQIQPVPSPGQPLTRPTKPGTPTTKPGFDREKPSTKPIHTQPAKPEARPAPQPKPRPEAKPSPAPAPMPRPTPRPSGPSIQPHQPSNPGRENSKRPAPQAQPKSQGRPQSKTQPRGGPATQ